MSRPKPQVLTEITSKTTFKTEQVLASAGIWAVFFDGQPINLKSFHYLGHGPGPKYKKVSFLKLIKDLLQISLCAIINEI